METAHSLLGHCLLINVGILIFWFVVYGLARELIAKFHGKIFRLAPEQMEAIHYGGMGLYKLLIIVFNLVPWLAMKALL